LNLRAQRRVAAIDLGGNQDAQPFFDSLPFGGSGSASSEKARTPSPCTRTPSRRPERRGETAPRMLKAAWSFIATGLARCMRGLSRAGRYREIAPIGGREWTPQKSRGAMDV
jgi:hypothetical protein